MIILNLPYASCSKVIRLRKYLACFSNTMKKEFHSLMASS